MTKADDAITFNASFPAIQSAIKVTGDGGGMRIQLDIPESDLLNALHLLALRETVFTVTIVPNHNDGKSNTNQRKATY